MNKDIKQKPILESEQISTKMKLHNEIKEEKKIYTEPQKIKKKNHLILLKKCLILQCFQI